MRDIESWGVLTIGTGLGNARFTNRTTAAEAPLSETPESAAPSA